MFITKRDKERALELSQKAADRSCVGDLPEDVRTLLVSAGLYLHKMGEYAEAYEWPEVPSKYKKAD